MKVNAPNILSSLLRHHVRPGLTGNEKSAEIADVLKELSNAPTAAEKHAIIERLLLREQRELLAAKTASAETPGFTTGEEPEPHTWRMSAKSTEVMNGLKTEHFSRQWETEAIIRAIFEQAGHGNGGDEIAGLATPFKPTAHDMAKAIESLGYSSRALYRDDPQPFSMDTDHETSGMTSRLVLMTSGILIVTVVLLML